MFSFFRRKPSTVDRVNEANQIFGFGDAKLYSTLVREELKEALQEIRRKEPDREYLLKEVCDLIWVANGFALTQFTPQEIERAFEEVYKSNMSKVCTRKQAEPYLEDHEYIEINETTGYLRRKSDGKYVKGPNYTLPNLSFINQ